LAGVARRPMASYALGAKLLVFNQLALGWSNGIGEADEPAQCTHQRAARRMAGTS
jgi:hypothetical protein